MNLTTDLISQILLGGLLGIIGQGVRVIVGLTKLHTENAVKALAQQPTDDFSISRLLLSLFIGFIAGAIASIIKGAPAAGQGLSQYILTILAAGYAGVDFIEGVFKPYLSKLTTPATTSAQKSALKQSIKVESAFKSGAASSGKTSSVTIKGTFDSPGTNEVLFKIHRPNPNPYDYANDIDDDFTIPLTDLKAGEAYHVLLSGSTTGNFTLAIDGDIDTPISLPYSNVFVDGFTFNTK